MSATSPSPATVQIIDLTTRLGVFSLAQLGIDVDLSAGPWLQLGLQGNASRHRLDWHRSGTLAHLPGLSGQASEIWLLVGPGSVSLLDTLEASLQTISLTAPVRAFFAPNALMEKMCLKRWKQGVLNALDLQELPDTDPKTLWFLLCGQLSKLPASDLEHQPSFNKPGSFSMPSNLNASLEAVLTLDGAMGVALVDHTSGMCLAKAGGGVNLDVAAAGNTEVVRAKLKTMQSLGITKGIEDILITLHNQYHLIRLVPNHAGLFLYLVIDKSRGNLALARYKLMDIERALTL